MGFTSVFAMEIIIFNKNTDPKNQISLFLFCRPTGRPYFFFAVLPVDQKINLVLPNLISYLS